MFLTELQNQEVLDGYPVSFDCVVTGQPVPSVRWFKDGRVLEEDDHYMIDLELCAATRQGARGRQRRGRCLDFLPPPPDRVGRKSFLDEGRRALLTEEARARWLRGWRRQAPSEEPRGEESGREEPSPTT